jgi:hypothetical protein
MHRWAVSVPLLVCIAAIAGWVIVAVPKDQEHLLSVGSALAGVAAFLGFILIVKRFSLSWRYSIPFVLYGFLQILWAANFAYNKFIFSTGFWSIAYVLRVALMLVWTRLILVVLSRAEESRAIVEEELASAVPASYIGGNLEVMISSTVEDLAQERDAADEAIRALNLSRFRAESFGSLPYTPRSVCAYMAERCDLMLLIIGDRYGYVIEGEDISVVEFEFNIAQKQDPRKILVYVKRVSHRPERLATFLARVEDFDHGYFRSNFETPEELFTLIQRDVTRWLVNKLRSSEAIAPT